jgi:hypothetical protein
MDLGPCAVSAIQIKPRSVRLIINRPAVRGYSPSDSTASPRSNASNPRAPNVRSLDPSPPSAQHPGADLESAIQDENSPPWCGSRGLFHASPERDKISERLAAARPSASSPLKSSQFLGRLRRSQSALTNH